MVFSYITKKFSGRPSPDLNKDQMSAAPELEQYPVMIEIVDDAGHVVDTRGGSSAPVSIPRSGHQRHNTDLGNHHRQYQNDHSRVRRHASEYRSPHEHGHNHAAHTKHRYHSQGNYQWTTQQQHYNNHDHLTEAARFESPDDSRIIFASEGLKFGTPEKFEMCDTGGLMYGIGSQAGAIPGNSWQASQSWPVNSVQHRSVSLEQMMSWDWSSIQKIYVVCEGKKIRVRRNHENWVRKMWNKLEWVIFVNSGIETWYSTW